MSKASCVDLKVVETTPLGRDPGRGGVFFLRLEPPGWSEGWRPGQFVMLRPHCFGSELVWGRPLSICMEDEDGLVLLVQKAGRGTLKLADLAPGDPVTVWGPLGTGFAMEADTPTLLLAGGIGLAPFLGYALRHPRPENLSLLFGHRAPIENYPWSRLEERIRAERFHEQGPGDLERFIGLVRQRMVENAGAGLALACGPDPFLRTVQALARELGARAQLSLENRMACGMGACLGCVANSPAGLPVQVCTKGPVFDAEAVTL